MATGERKDLLDEIQRLKKRLAKKNRETRALKTKNLFMESLFDGISEEIMVVGQDFRINDANRAFLDRCGLKKKEVLGKRCYELVERPWTPCNSEGGFCPVKRAGNINETVEMTHSYRDERGDTREFIIIIYPLRTEDEEVKYFLEITRDVTEYRNLIMKLQRSEKRFRAILDTAIDAIISIDEDHRIILFNNTARKMFGYSVQEIMGEGLEVLISPGYGKDYKRMERFLEEGDLAVVGNTLSLTGHRRDGEKFPINLSLSFLEMGGKITYTAIIRDTTEQRKLENRMLQSERLAAVGQAVAHVAHEIRNPLMIIGGFTNQIRAKLDDEKDLHKIDMVIEEVMRLERLVADLGDFTKGYRLVKRPADINSVIQDVIKIMTGVWPDDRYSFKKILSRDVNEINCDPDKLKQVFINIISNGLEAMQEGGTISISTEKIPRGIEIRINDEGVGISHDQLQRIFEPFYTTRDSGSGLGLSISYKLIEAHNGDIWAVSSPGKGSTFIIQLPF